MKFVCDDPVRQKCRHCSGTYDRDVAFRKNSHQRKNRGLAIAGPDIHATCIGCEQTARDGHKAVEPFIAKARSTIKHHAMRYGITSSKMITYYGWDIDRVAHLLRHAYENTCVYCRRPYHSMRNGPSDVTMDIINPREAPYLETNTQPCCQTCNQSKSDSSPEMWARKLRFWREWEANSLVPVSSRQFSLMLDAR